MEKINYEKIIEKHPWIVEKNKKCILSPDIDGLLCGLLMSHYLNWEIVGFYDGKVLIIKTGLQTKDCIFLDMEILRKGIRSVGHHMNVHIINKPPANYHKIMNSCINPNHIRGFDRIANFSSKYPLGTVHLLMYILENKYPGVIKIKKGGLASLFFADGVWKILFKYTRNVMGWFTYLHSGKEADWWVKLRKLSVIELIEEINSLLSEFKKIKDDNKDWYGHIDISSLDKDKVLLAKTLELLGGLTGWNYKSTKWKLQNLKEFQFTKKIYGQIKGSRSNEQFFRIWNKKPLSLAMTEGSVIQYTIEKPVRMP